MLRRLTRIVVGILAAGLVAVAIIGASDPLRWPDKSLRSWLLKQAPLGSSLEQVRAIAKARGWFDPFRQRGDGASYGPYLRGELGRYWSGVVRVYVSAIWEFDSSNRLAHVRIWKKTEKP